MSRVIQSVQQNKGSQVAQDARKAAQATKHLTTGHTKGGGKMKGSGHMKGGG